MSRKNEGGPNTRLVHAGLPEDAPGGAVAFPIFQSATYRNTGREEPQDILYLRYSNTPNQVVLGARLAAVHGAEAGLVTASGMAAISATLSSLHVAGDHLLVLDSLYGGTQAFIAEDLPRWGIESTSIRGDDPDSWEGLLRPETKSIYVETLTNPLLRVPDHGAIVEFAARHGLTTVIDNTFATPVQFRPVEHGYHLVVESCTKYIGGHSDLVAGAVVGSAERVERVRLALNHLGGSLDPHAAFLTMRGLVTLGLRVRRQAETAAQLAGWLAARDDVTRVHYPGLADHPDHERAGRWLDGFGGMLCFELGSTTDEIERWLRELELITVASSLGGPETLVTRPAVTSHAALSAEQRAAVGIGDGLVRISVGLEDAPDLIADMQAAFERIAATSDALPARRP